ncbi:MAG TPA: glycosyltransferase family 4 protein [Phycisphaerales bacterium]|nr:glycosyltransferase family 4 protein [Phycisphaerales bacterium]HMP35843.1 glycosyltransferase family 4 protein [Phycisphaerales bacterium]
MRLALLGKHPQFVLAYRGSLIRAAQRLGHEVHAVTGRIEAESASEAAVRRSLDAAGVRLHEVALDGGGTNPLRDLRTRRQLRRTLAAIRPDAVFCYNPKLVAYGPPAARAAGVPRVAAMVTGLGYAFTGRGLRRALVRAVVRSLYRRALPCCDAVFFQNRDDAAELRAHGILDDSTPVRFVGGSGVDLEHFRQRPIPAGVHFLMIARLLRDKGVVEYAEACAEVARTHPEATFTLLGGRDDNPTAVDSATIEAWRVRGVPRLEAPVADVRPILEACTVFVLPSWREGTSKTMLEAMAIGRAVVTTDAVGCREPIEAGVNGLLVPLRDPPALAAAMRRLADDRATVERMGAAGRRVAEERFDATIVDRAILSSLGLAPG